MTFGKLVGTVTTECCCQEITVGIVVEGTSEVGIEFVTILIALCQIDIGASCFTGDDIGYGI